MNNNFLTFAKYLGIGDIDSKIWFVGLEEGGVSISKSNLQAELKKCEENIHFWENVSSYTPVWNIISELVYEKFFNIHKLSFSEYRSRMFHEDFSFFFLAELFPLARPNNSTWSEEYYEIFGYKKSDYHKYLSDVRSIRFPVVYAEWIEKKPRITICFGSSYWNEFINLFKLGHSSFQIIQDTNLVLFPNENVLLCPFFDYRIIKAHERDILKNYIPNQPL